MKNSEGYPGYDIPVNIGRSQDLQTSMLHGVKDVVYGILENGQAKNRGERLINAINLIDHTLKLMAKDAEYYEFMRQKIESLTEKITENEK